MLVNNNKLLSWRLWCIWIGLARISSWRGSRFNKLAAVFKEFFFKVDNSAFIFIIKVDMRAFFYFLFNIRFLHKISQLIAPNSLKSLIFQFIDEILLKIQIFNQLLQKLLFHLHDIFRLLFLELVYHLIIDILQFISQFFNLLENEVPNSLKMIFYGLYRHHTDISTMQPLTLFLADSSQVVASLVKLKLLDFMETFCFFVFLHFMANLLRIYKIVNISSV